MTMRRIAPVPIRVFHIRPETRSRLSVRVEVFRTMADFHGAIRDEARAFGFSPYPTRALLGYCCGVIERRRGRRTGLFAIIRLPQAHLTMGTITHEAFHATMRWAERRGITLTSVPSDHPAVRIRSVEERAAKVHDAICRAVVSRLRRFKLLPA